MILPVNLIKDVKSGTFNIGDKLILVKENNSSIVYFALTLKKEKIGQLSSRSLNNPKVRSKLGNEYIQGKVFAIFQNQILLDMIFYKKDTSESIIK